MLKSNVFLQEIDGRKNPAKGGGQDGTGTAHYALSGTGASRNHTGNHGKGVKPNENPHRCPCSTQRFRKGRIRVGRKCFQSGSGDVYTDLSAKGRNGQKSSRKAGHTGRSPQRSGKSVPQRTKGNGAETAAKARRQPIV